VAHSGPAAIDGVGPVAIERIEVPNTEFMRDQPTNGMIVGSGEVMIVDPGDDGGVELFLAALTTRREPRVRGILLTHAHPDHANAAGPLRRAFDCPIYLHPRERPVLEQFARLSWADIDEELSDGMEIAVGEGRLTVVETPGHSPGHVAFFDPVSSTLIAGDLVSGQSTVGIFPPLGKMREYLDSLFRAKRLSPRLVIPGHGQPITEPDSLFDLYIELRLARENQILDALAQRLTTVDAIVGQIYVGIQEQFRGAAASTVLAHLIKLQEDGRADADSDEPRTSTWRLAR
jgi:glyoxylase-like metal-dependent hydrolase (beta-lactamase superfamily II)